MSRFKTFRQKTGSYRNRPVSGKINYNKILTIVLAVLIGIIFFTTVFMFMFRREKIGSQYRKADPTPQKVINMSLKTDEKVDAYTDVGQVRIALTDGNTLVVAPWFSYPQGDTVLFEELSQKERQARQIINTYLGQHSMNELMSLGEKKIKEELKELINQELVLGQIRAIYFNEYMFF